MRKSILLFMLIILGISTNSQLVSSTKNENEMNYTILVMYQATNHWLELSREERSEFFSENTAPIMQKFKDKLNIRLFDSEAFHATTSDYMIIECADLKDYYYFMEYLRDTKMFSKPYIILNDVIIGIENGFKDFEDNEYNKK